MTHAFRLDTHSEYFPPNGDSEYPYDVPTEHLTPHGRQLRRRFEILRKMPTTGALRTTPRSTVGKRPKPSEQRRNLPPSKSLIQRVTAFSDADRHFSPTLPPSTASKARQSPPQLRGSRYNEDRREDMDLPPSPENRVNSNNNTAAATSSLDDNMKTSQVIN